MEEMFSTSKPAGRIDGSPKKQINDHFFAGPNIALHDTGTGHKKCVKQNKEIAHLTTPTLTIMDAALLNDQEHD
jgi:hypothetical protein